MRAEVDKRWEEISTRNAGMEGRNELLEWRLMDLQEQVDALVARRDALLADTQQDLEEAKEAVRATRSRDSLRQLQDNMVVLPDVDSDEEGEESHGSVQDPSSSEGTTRFPA
jgi:methionine synthase I (cobalamin-dependent)